MAAAKRSRTGCVTCRKRKLKCDEIRPVCGQCTKSRRECIPSDGVAFRHEQNAGLNSEQEGDRSLGNFFKYRNEYTAAQMYNFIPTGPNYEWRYVTDVYAEDTDQPTPINPTSPQTYQREVASHTLEALSTAAAENQAYQPPVTYADINFYTGGGGYGPAGLNIQGSNQTYKINQLLNPQTTSSAMIDPNLDASALESMRHEAENNANENAYKINEDDTQQEEQQDANDEQIRRLLAQESANSLEANGLENSVS